MCSNSWSKLRFSLQTELYTSSLISRLMIVIYSHVTSSPPPSCTSLKPCIIRVPQASRPRGAAIHAPQRFQGVVSVGRKGRVRRFRGTLDVEGEEVTTWGQWIQNHGEVVFFLKGLGNVRLFFAWEIQVYREMINYQARGILNYHPCTVLRNSIECFSMQFPSLFQGSQLSETARMLGEVSWFMIHHRPPPTWEI